ncbi:MAG: tripartite tricarboxylate transporter TctB family protein [Granulosicoccus sp.]|nr:tripartite tricarboxylate transporter TctB family protein [Granulosicoccus sp.]
MTIEKAEKSVVFEGEEAGAGYASPTLDLIAACFLVALSLVVMWASWALPVPGDWLTAPGLLPFITSLSLLVMAVILGATALRRSDQGKSDKERSGKERTGEERTGKQRNKQQIASEAASVDRSQVYRTLLLMILVGIYILALQQLAFLIDFSIGSVFFSISAFEPITVTVLAAIIHIYWRGSLWITSVISLLWTLLLSLVFQKAFNIPLPGSF